MSSKLYNGGDHFLYLLPGQPQLAPDGRTLNVDEEVICVFTELSNKDKEKQVHLSIRCSEPLPQPNFNSDAAARLVATPFVDPATITDLNHQYV